MRLPLLQFQILTVLSAVPPPEARRPGCQGHQARAFTAAWCWLQKRGKKTQKHLRKCSRLCEGAADLRKSEFWRGLRVAFGPFCLPHVEHVVVAAAGEQFAVRGPGEAADLCEKRYNNCTFVSPIISFGPAHLLRVALDDAD